MDDKTSHHWGATVSLDLSTSSGGTSLICTKVTSDSPLLSNDGLSSLIELGSHVEVVNFGLSSLGLSTAENNEGVDLKVCEMKVDVYRVETDDEIQEDILLVTLDAF